MTFYVNFTNDLTDMTFHSGCNYIGGTTEDTQSDAAWLVPICLQLGPAIILFVGMIWMPFSPRWLIHHGREQEARKILADLRDLPENHELIELEFLEIKAQSLFEKRSTAELFPHLKEQTAWNIFKLQFVAIKALFQTKAMFKRVIVATVTMVSPTTCRVIALHQVVKYRLLTNSSSSNNGQVSTL